MSDQPEEAAPATVPADTSDAPAPPETSETDSSQVIQEQARLRDVIDPAQVRRAPRLGSFLAVGLLIAVLAALGFSFVRDAFLPAAQVQARALDSWGTFWVLLAFFAPIAALCSYGIAVALDRRSLKRWRKRRGGADSDPSSPS